MTLDETLQALGDTSKEEDYYVPEDSGLKPSQSTSKLITTEKDLTNASGEATLIRPNTPAPTQRPPTFTEYSNNLFDTIRNQMDLIGKESDTLKKETAISALKGSIAETGAILQKETRLIAERQVGLPQLQAALRRAEQLDRADPLWSQHLVDSKETQGIRRQVEAAQGKAIQLAKQMISENPVIASMGAQVDSFLRNQEALVRSDMNREEKRKDLIDQEIVNLGQDTTKYLSYLYPEVNGDVRKAAEVKLNARLDPNRKELAPILSPSFTEDQLLPLSFMGNKPAQLIAIKAHSEKVGQSEDLIRKELSTANRFVNDEAFFTEQMKQMGSTDPAYRTMLTEYTKASVMAGIGKEAQKQRLIQRAGLVDQWMTKQKTNQAMNDVESWSGDITLRSIPEVAQAIDKIKTMNNGKKVSLDDLVGIYIGQAPKEQQAQRFDNIKTAIKSSVERSQKGLYGHLDEVSMINRLKISNGFNSASLGSFIDTFGTTMADYINTNPGLTNNPLIGGVR